MGNIKRSPVWDDPRVKPPFGAAALDLTHPFMRGVQFYSALLSGAGIAARDDRPQGPETATGPLLWANGPVGTEFYVGSGGNLRYALTTADSIQAPLTIVCQVRFTGAADKVVLHYKCNDNNFKVSTNQFAGGDLTSFAGAQLHTNGAINNGRPRTCIFAVAANGSTSTCYLDGAAVMTTTTTATITYSRNNVAIGSKHDGTDEFGEPGISFVGVFANLWSESQAREFTDAPYVAFRPIIRRRYFVSQVAAAGVSTVRRRLPLLGVGS